MLSPDRFPETRPSLLDALDSQAETSGWRTFFACYAPAVFRVARGRGLGEADAEDVVQQVMLQVSKHISDFDYSPARGKFRNWIRAITETKIIDFFRRNRPVVSSDLVAEQLSTQDAADHEDPWQREWELMDILRCIDEVARDVSPRRMEAFRMYSLEGRSATETAKALEMTENHVYVIRSQILALVRKRLAELHGEA